MLKLVNITKDYKIGNNDLVHALKGINIEFRNSEFVSILGQSGCGKTTLLNIIGGLDKYTDGDLIINGVTTKNYKDNDWDSYRNHHIGFIFQSYNLISHQTVLSNVELSLTISGISKKERREKAIEALNKVGLGDQINKKPNQLSGGQMQRVAIARAIVNDPKIILADEPTGALDSKTSIQVMDILKEISKDRLVIMVTHNSELAEKYSTRIVRLVDGLVTDDSKPYDSKENEEVKEEKTKKTSMGFLTALSLSFKNLITKKARTILTAIAGSIGIIGIALVLSLSNGFTTYIDKIQSDTLSSYPLSITTTTIDLNSVIETMTSSQKLEKYPNIQKVYINKISEKLQNIQKTNKFTKEYIEYVEEIDKDLLIGVTYTDSVDIFASVNGQVVKVNGKNSNSTFQEMIDNEKFISSQYDVIDIDGRLPSNYNEIVVVVDQYNRISDTTLMTLGYDIKDKETISFEDIKNTEFTFYSNQDIYYGNDTDGYKTKLFESKGMAICLDKNNCFDENSGFKVKVVGIVRVNQDTTMGSLNSTIAYPRALREHVDELNKDSDVNKYVEAGNSNIATSNSTDYKKSLGVNDLPDAIKIYPVNFDSKEEIKAYLDAYNVGKEEIDQIKYLDEMELMIDMLNTMINTITYVLVAFTAISLVVSSIMIAIITYVSVIERTKEIGVLRAIGTRKKDISRVFNAETFIIGLVAGVIGIVVTILLNFPINMVISSLVEGVGNISALNPIHAIILVIISIVLTLISGFIPSKIAAKKDPVIALRSE